MVKCQWQASPLLPSYHFALKNKYQQNDVPVILTFPGRKCQAYFWHITIFINNSQTMYPSKVKITQHSLHTRTFKKKNLSPKELTIVPKKN